MLCHSFVADAVALDVRLAPEAVAGRIASAINRPPRRAFGLLKTENEFVGIVRGTEFEIWERRNHAVHAVGIVQGRRGRSRVELRTRLTPRTRWQLALFFALFALAVVAFALTPSDRPPLLPTPLVGVAGAAVLGAVFYVGANRQRADLERFVRSILADVAEP